MSIDTKMAWRNIWRNTRRTVLTISAIAFASLLLVFMLSFQFGSYETMINTSVKIQTGHLQIQADDYQEKKNIRSVVSNPADLGILLDEIPQVESYTLRGQAFSLVSSRERTYGVLVTGVDPAREARVSRLKSLIRRGTYLSAGDIDQALVGNIIARNLRIDIGDELTILGQARDGSIAATVARVKGIYSSGIDDFDRATIQIPLGTFQELYSMQGAVHEVVIIAASLADVDDIKAGIKTALPAVKSKRQLTVLDWNELMPGLCQSIEMDLISGLIFYLLLVLVVAFSILNTFLMAIFERTREFGVLMALGTTPGRLTKVLLIESMAMTLLGIVAGITIGSLITLYFQTHGFDISGASELLSQFGISGRIYPKLTWLSAISGPLAVLVITFLAALYPALRVQRMHPVEAMRAV
ncbi:LolE-like permease protein [Olavius sp. associated proteobacterium Delta 1]|nr:LolE-like permease protein [Olavius sp. associated proteobacterium Delta 1]